MTETAVTRLAQALDPWAPGAEQDSIRLARADAQALLNRIADLCEDHSRCSICSTPLCVTCGLGESAGCPDRHSFEDHCADCAGECQVCSREVADDARAEAYADAIGGRY